VQVIVLLFNTTSIISVNFEGLLTKLLLIMLVKGMNAIKRMNVKNACEKNFAEYLSYYDAGS